MLRWTGLARKNPASRKKTPVLRLLLPPAVHKSASLSMCAAAMVTTRGKPENLPTHGNSKNCETPHPHLPAFGYGRACPWSSVGTPRVRRLLHYTGADTRRSTAGNFANGAYPRE
jgi:hypothetical protein